ncbi:MAG: hypothetical protein PVH77_10320 [Phycisphaerales bacterium]|jgi:hypothetical protein
MGQPKSDFDKAIMRYETICGRIFVRVVMVVLPLLLLDYISPFLWFHRRSKIIREFPVEVVRQPKPYVMFGGVKNGSIYNGEKLNNLGYRGKAPQMPKTSEEFRILMLGGSTVVNGKPPIPVLLEDEFRGNGMDNVQIYNFGVVSSASSMELARILFEIPELQPDLIIMYNGGNDIFTPYKYDPRPGYPFNFIVYENNPILESDVRSYPTFSLLLYGSNLARCFLSRFFVNRFVPLDKERQKAGWGSDEWRDEIAQRYVSNLMKAKKMSNVFGSKFIAFLQPMVDYKDTLSAEEKEHRPDPEFKEHCIDVRNRILKKISKTSKESSPILVDLTDIYDKTSTRVFIDKVHTTQESKGLVAKAIYENVVGNFKIE